MVAGSFLLIGGRLLGKGDFDDGQESFLLDPDESFLLGLKDINNLFFRDGDDLVKAGYFSADDFGDPEGSVDESFGSFDGHEFLVFTEEESESPGDILAYKLVERLYHRWGRTS